MYAAAVGDQKCESCPGNDPQRPAGYGAACCGKDCYITGQIGGNCVYPAATMWFNNLDFTNILFCASIEAVRANQGVLCCRGS
ncbi:MAG TPA: hypothetical protein VJR89_21300 [Polyangiales bacterium]|nr:hypothetical protein [Polyangiales bacterium]